MCLSPVMSCAPGPRAPCPRAQARVDVLSPSCLPLSGCPATCRSPLHLPSSQLGARGSGSRPGACGGKGSPGDAGMADVWPPLPLPGPPGSWPLRNVPERLVCSLANRPSARNPAVGGGGGLPAATLGEQPSALGAVRAPGATLATVLTCEAQPLLPLCHEAPGHMVPSCGPKARPTCQLCRLCPQPRSQASELWAQRDRQGTEGPSGHHSTGWGPGSTPAGPRLLPASAAPSAAALASRDTPAKQVTSAEGSARALWPQHHTHASGWVARPVGWGRAGDDSHVSRPSAGQALRSSGPRPEGRCPETRLGGAGPGSRTVSRSCQLLRGPPCRSRG